MTYLILIITAYILGSVPFGYVIGKLNGVDITKVGSGNIGATNISRTLGFKTGVLVFVLDLLKGTLAISIAIMYDPDPFFIIIIGISAIIGHMFSMFLKFKGGKGAAVGLGVLLGIAPDVFFFTFFIVLMVMLISKYVSLSSIIGSISASLLMLILGKPFPYIFVTFAGTFLILLKHRENMSRLMQGTERKIGEKN